jgi:MFS family permease
MTAAADTKPWHAWRVGFWLLAPHGIANLGLATVLGNLYLLRLGYGPAFIGIIFAVGRIAYVLACFVAPRLASTWGHRRNLVLGLAACGAARCLFAGADLVPAGSRSAFVIATSSVAWAGLAVYYVSKGPYMMRIGGREAQRRFFSIEQVYVYLSTFAGQVIGGVAPVAFAILLATVASDTSVYRYPLLVAGAISIAAAFLLPRLDHDPEEPRPSRERAEPAEVAKSPPPASLGFLTYMVIAYGLVMTSHNMMLGFFNMYLDDGLHVSPALNGQVSGVAALLAAPAALLAPWFVRRWGLSLPFLLVAFAMASGLAIIGLYPVWTAAAIGFLLLNIAGAVRSPIQNHYYMEIVPPYQRGSMSAMMMLAIQINGAIVGVVGGYVAKTIGYGVVFVASAIVTALGGLMLSWRMRTAPDPRAVSAPT